MDQTILELFSRLTAIEYLLMHQQKLAYQIARMTPDDAETFIQVSIEMLKSQTYPGFPDPAESDQYAAAVEENITKLLRGAKAMLALDLERKT